MDKAVESLLAVAIVISGAGGALVSAGKTWEGLACFAAGSAVVFLRAYIKK